MADTETKQRFFEIVRENDSPKLIAFLRENQGYDVNLKDESGSCGLHLCIGNLVCVKELLGNGADINVTDMDGWKPIHLAAQNDFTQSLLQFIVRGADIDEECGPENGKRSPLQCSIATDSKTCLDFLLFSGAKVDKVDKELGYTTKQNQQIIIQGYKEKKITVGGVSVLQSPNMTELTSITRDSRNDRNENTILNIGNTVGRDDFDIFVRSVQVEYQSSGYHCPEVLKKDGEELVSDIYQYTVDKDVTCDIRVPIYGRYTGPTSKYHEYTVAQVLHLGGEARHDDNTHVTVEDNQRTKWALISGIALKAHGSSPIISLGIFRKNKEELTKLERGRVKEQQIQHSVDTCFKVSVPPDSLKEATSIALQVLKVDHTLERSHSKDSGIGDCSDFCSVSPLSCDGRTLSMASLQSIPSDSVEGKVNIQLPRPQNADNNKMTVVRKSPDLDGSDPNHFDIVNSLQIEDGNGVVKVNDTECGVFIAVSVNKKSHWLKSMVKYLYEIATGKRADCVFFVLLKEIKPSLYLVKVILSAEQEQKETVEQEQKEAAKDKPNEGFKLHKFKPVIPIKINTRYKYMLKVVCNGADVTIPDCLPIQHQGKSIPKSQIFTITATSKQPSCNVMAFKKNVPAKQDDYGLKIKAKIPVLLDTSEERFVDEAEFPSDKFINSISKQIGIEHWYALGILLGYPNETVCSFEDIRSPKRAEMILLKWRDQYLDKIEEGLKYLFQALKLTERLDLRNEFVREINKPMYRSSRALRARQFIGNHHVDGSVYDFSGIPDIIVSPFEDIFLYRVASILSPNVSFLIELQNLSTNKIEEMLERVKPNPKRNAITRLLVAARQNDGNSPPLKFLANLVKHISEERLFLSLDEIKKLVRSWCDTCASDETEETKTRLRTIFKL